MYTICWSANAHDHWERCDDRTAVAALLIREGLRDDADILIFTPEADDCTTTVEDIFAGI